ncbi:MAG: N-acetylmuramoyl-L-alanine amidase [Sphingobacteriia bacterium]|jgi:N-acetylmuramoyl-L-alanine amidase
MRPLSLCLFSLLFAFSSFTWVAPRPVRQVRLIVLDAGHGGKDAGAIGASKRNYEKNVTLAISNKLSQMLTANDPNIKVVRTRSTDAFVGLYERADEANDKHADLFISIHCNSNSDPSAHGIETYAVGMHKSEAQLDVIMQENSSILMEDNHTQKYDGFNPKSPEAYIMFRLTQHAHHQESLSLAQKIQKSIVTTTQRYDRGVKQAGFLVLWRTSMPSVLVETGFISNPNEEKFLTSNEGQDHISSSIYQAIKAYRGI